MVTPALKVGTE